MPSLNAVNPNDEKWDREYKTEDYAGELHMQQPLIAFQSGYRILTFNW
jgi:hypothetical protein